jgi:hypothetical protein
MEQNTPYTPIDQIDPTFIRVAKKMFLETEEKAPAEKLDDPRFEDSFGDRTTSLRQIINEIRENKLPGMEYIYALADILQVQK